MFFKKTGDIANRAAEEIWLNYFNRYLFEHGTISEKEYNMMTQKISEYMLRRYAFNVLR